MTASPALFAELDFDQPLHAGAARLRLRFARPQQVLEAHDAPSLLQVLRQVEDAARQGRWCVGGLRYEAASALDPLLPTHAASMPLAWFAVFDAAQPAALPDAALCTQSAWALEWKDALDRQRFDADMACIHAAIADGAYYQINYTQQLQAQVQGHIPGRQLFAALQRAQPGGYALYLDMGREQIASVSPELFFDWHQPARGSGDILARPMKGTAARGATAPADAAQAQHLQRSAKERAENVMIVDLLRNDLGRLAQTGSVHVPQLFAVQALPTVWQMTSDVRARLPQHTCLLDIFRALFPCGSVTGAPKRAAMQAITQLEPAARGWYCGALGVVRSDGAGGVRATFNVPIRTVVQQGQQLRCGIGSGITADATSAGEWQEWRAKRAFVERISMGFDIVETLALVHGQLRHADLHLQRMAAAAAHFRYPWSEEAARMTLEHVVHTHPSGQWRVRIQLSAAGLFGSTVQVLQTTPEPVLLQLANEPLAEAHSEFVRFKTTRRAHYERLAPKAPQVFDTIVWNEAGEITECTRGNIAACIQGQWVTPAVSCGLLAGIGRQVALAQGRVVEGVIRVEDLPRVQAWAFVNSLRGWLDASVQPGPAPVSAG